MKRKNRRRSLDIAVCVALVLLSLLAVRKNVLAYNNAEHQDIGQHARANYIAYVLAHPDSCVGAQALEVHWADIAWGLEHEDDGVLSRRHFWDPYTGYPGLGVYLPWPLGRQPSAVATAADYWTNQVLPAYANGQYQLAYQTLGRVVHLAMDMGVPAHANLDPHLVADWYESTYISVAEHHVHTSNISTAASLYSLMEAVALASRNFDSNDADGVDDQGTRSAGGFTEAEGAEIAEICYPGAEEAAGGIFKLFYDTVKPIVQLARPTQSEVHSGIISIPFEAQARSYEHEFTDADYIAVVQFDYCTSDEPGANDWVYAGEDTILNEESEYTFFWFNTIDDDKVWVRATAIDDGACDSLSDEVWIRIDSTRPTVTSTHP